MFRPISAQAAAAAFPSQAAKSGRGRISVPPTLAFSAAHSSGFGHAGSEGRTRRTSPPAGATADPADPGSTENSEAAARPLKISRLRMPDSPLRLSGARKAQTL